MATSRSGCSNFGNYWCQVRRAKAEHAMFLVAQSPANAMNLLHLVIDSSFLLVQCALQLPGPRFLQCSFGERCRALHTDAHQVAGRRCAWRAGVCFQGLPSGAPQVATPHTMHQQVEKMPGLLLLFSLAHDKFADTHPSMVVAVKARLGLA